MLGDTGVAVHPDDERYAALVGMRVRLPLVGRLIPIVADGYSDPEKGSGAVKITPAHDFNDFEVGRRQGLAVINILDAEARLALQGNDVFLAGIAEDGEARSTALHLHGLSREEARRRIVEMMDEAGLLERTEPHAHAVPHGDRSGVVIEPWLTDQWYVDAKVLAEPALAAVRAGRTRFVPRQYERTFYDWLEGIQPWCVSRQLWWGHQIPAWYGPDGSVFVAESPESAAADAARHYGGSVPLTRDEDVLDTWFSSALWPFSTLGWPDEEGGVLARRYPTSVLVTGFDIIFFWVARMMMMGLHLLDDVPFRDVYMHALVRDERGAKMSKSKGNVLDPLDFIDGIGLPELIAKRTAGLADRRDVDRVAAATRKDYPDGIDRFGADALRFTLAAMAVQGRDIKLSVKRVEGYRGFATKIWNAARFAELNGCARVDGFDPTRSRVTLNRWILGETAKAVAEVTAAIEAYRFNEAAGAAYRFVWNTFCDWYLELAKPLLQGEPVEDRARIETRATVSFVLDEIFKLLHPFMPFLTEELWAIKGAEGPPRESVLALAPWSGLPSLKDADAADEVGWVVTLVSELRSVRAEMNVPAAALVPLVLVGTDATIAGWTVTWADTLKRLARLSDISSAGEAPPRSVQVPVRGSVAALPLDGIIDFDAEKARLRKDTGKLRGEADKIEAKLGNADFIARAPEDVVEEQRERLAEVLGRREKLTLALQRLGG